MNQTGDHDGKSQTASALDADHYPEMKPVDNDAVTQAEIAKLAHALWIKRARPHGSAERDWQDAEQELMHGRTSQAQIRHVHEVGGSVQA